METQTIILINVGILGFVTIFYIIWNLMRKNEKLEDALDKRDKYIDELCENDPDLDAKYGIASNKGYGTKKHIEGIKKHGITCYHRLSYKTCR